jgi:NADH-quinone oxidoreductase subunit K
MNPLQTCLLVSSLLFSIGLMAAVARGNVIFVLLGIELMLNAANLNFVAFWRFGPASVSSDGIIFVIFSIAVAAAEAAVGLALVISLNRHQKNIRLEDAVRMKG